MFDRRVIHHFDFALFGAGLLIPCLGLIVLYSAGYDPSTESVSLGIFSESVKSVAFVKQLGFIGAGLIALLFGMALSGPSLQRFAYLFYGICVILLIAVLVFGSISHGAQRWLSAGGMNLQPSEPMKIGVILALARYLSRTQIPEGGFGLLRLFVPLMIFLIPMALIIRQPDLGTALSVGAVGLMMIAFIGIRPRTIAMMVGAVGLSIKPAWDILHPYQRRRVMSLLNPEADPLGAGYHLAQSKIAVGSGGVFGKGFLQGTQTQLEFLPEHTTDFVFSVLAEEWGFFGSMLILGLYMLLLYRLLRVSIKSKELFGSLVCFGVAALIFFHTVVNVGMVIGILPIVGITLPLFSYGGSSVVTFLFALGLALGISVRRFLFN